MIRRSKKQVFAFVWDYLTKRIFSWKNRLLSKPGKEIVIKIVSQTLSVYYISMFMILIDTCVELQKTMNSF